MVDIQRISHVFLKLESLHRTTSIATMFLWGLVYWGNMLSTLFVPWSEHGQVYRKGLRDTKIINYLVKCLIGFFFMAPSVVVLGT